jgi:dTDP-glucose 4,6-dehydratase
MLHFFGREAKAPMTPARSIPAPPAVQYALDSLCWLAALVLAVCFRYEFHTGNITWLPLVGLAAATVLLQLVLGWVFWLYRGRFAYGSFDEARALLSTAAATALLVGTPIALFGDRLEIPRSTLLIATPLAVVLMAAFRYAERLSFEQRSKPGKEAVPTLVYGAGVVGTQLVRQMMTDRDSPYLPVGLLDDDRSKKHRTIMGVPVLGRLRDLGHAVSETGAQVLIIAIARADAELLRKITDAGQKLGVAVKVLPRLKDVLDGHTRLSDVRDVSIEDLIGRQPIDTQVDSIAGYLAGKRVLVTGAGGSIGSELCRQIAKYGPAELIMLDRDETGLQTTQISISGHGLLDTSDVVLADIRDAGCLREIFSKRRPQVVFHAAALKHLPMLEQYPDEAWKTNVLGTRNVLQAARRAAVETFVNISTDKAANPTSVLGHSKRVAEKLTAWYGAETRMHYLSVRFGNVIGSRGSMLPTFQALIEAGGPITVTHPDVTRFFMTIPEACQLVIQAGGIGMPGEVLILDMGQPVRILDIAKRMIAQSGRDIDIVFTGLRHGEKMHEELVGEGEHDLRPIHPSISHARIDAMAPTSLDKEAWDYRLMTGGVFTGEIYVRRAQADVRRGASPAIRPRAVQAIEDDIAVPPV